MVKNSYFSTARRSLAIFALGSLLWGQINTEAMRKRDLSPGLHSDLSIDVSLIAGNSTLQNARGTLRFDYLKGAAHTFLVSSRHYGRTDTLFVNKGFIHLRRTMVLKEGLFIEGFVQNEFNQFIHLKNRNLAGGGLRIRWLGTEADPSGPSGGQASRRTGEKETPNLKFYTGIGAMWEQEQIRDAKDPEDALKNLLRSTNYLVFAWQPDERVLIQATTYIQPDVRHLKDFRVLFDGSLNFALTGKLTVAIKLSARYDNEPPVIREKDGSEKRIKRHDVEFTSGLAYMF